MSANGGKKDEFLLDVRNLKTYFKSEDNIVKAVDDVSFQLKRGETLGIVGESGSGKSVTALSIMQLVPKPIGQIVGGSILFNSPDKGILDLTKISEREMQQERGNDISMIFQEPMTSLNPVYSCGDQVMEAILLHQKLSKAEARKKTIELFEKVKLPRPNDIFYAYPHQISGGQKQRVMIAMAMSCNPSVLIADEPTTALDVTVQARILELMSQLRDENNMSIIFITHDLGVIAEIADRVMVMYHGKVVESGTTYDIFNNPQHPYTKGLLACRPRLNMKLRVLPVVSDFMERDESGNIVEKKDHKFSSVGHALLYNFVSEDEIKERQDDLKKKEPHLKVKDLQTYFPISKGLFGKVTDYVKAVDNVSFDVYPGETLGLVGESGCGKTTLGRTILRLIEPTGGDIYFEGKSIKDVQGEELRKLRKDMQIIFQDPYSSLNPRMTVGQAIIEPMRINGVLESDFQRRRRAVELLETVSLSAKQFERYPHEFSGGQRQRICIARALALNPKFIICDESVSALDVSVQAQVLNLLNKLKEDFNFTSIFISHDLSVVKFMSDRILVMNKGKIEEIGYAEEIYNNPQSEYTKKLINSIPKGDLAAIRNAMLKRSQGR
ncbi:ABC transporter ATP-binding protein [Sporocytophaga myxococcoides]|uniref:ABC transporter ATP-binding protein n=1 Tax=Sporocytophaga myxococcoides TaxID=153721 RepID=A0A098LML6_9BACT|nr:ABC transporter ATP-binding protein [Sporocytophaga myxococcoides]GAL87298.1 ABC transporter ATP-binding protein [Sporocytophaga myxococcoides]